MLWLLEILLEISGIDIWKNRLPLKLVSKDFYEKRHRQFATRPKCAALEDEMKALEDDLQPWKMRNYNEGMR